MIDHGYAQITVNSVHPSHWVAMFRDVRHFPSCFHDHMVEALAESITTSVEGTMRSVLSGLVKDVTS